MSHACQLISMKCAKISRKAQTPQTGSSTAARGSLRRGLVCLRVILCTNLQREQRGDSRMCAYNLFIAQKNKWVSKLLNF